MADPKGATVTIRFRWLKVWRWFVVFMWIKRRWWKLVVYEVVDRG